MYAVIFRAEIDRIDQEYSGMAAKLRALAFSRYGCVDFTSVTEGNQEIAISYWRNQEQIQAWRQDAQHLAAQQLGRSRWYKSYRVQVVKIEQEYDNTQRGVKAVANLKIRVYKDGSNEPTTTVTIPGGVLKIASKLIPKQAAASMQEKGIDLEEIIRLSENPEAHGTLIEVEEHEKNEKVVIALE